MSPLPPRNFVQDALDAFKALATKNDPTPQTWTSQFEQAGAKGLAQGYDPEIEQWNLADTAKKAAYELKSKFPNVRIVSGRRGTRKKQATAMAGNIVSNHKWIKETGYRYKEGAEELQKWVDGQSEDISESDIATGLEKIMDNWTDGQMALFSRHFIGMAFDVEPVTENAEQIKATMKSLAGGEDNFRDNEGGKVIWHAQFY